MVDNESMAAPEKVTIGTNHNQNTMDTPSKKNLDQEECGEILDDGGYDDQDKGGEIVNNQSTASPIEVTIGANHTQLSTDTTFNNNYDKEKGGYIVDDEIDDDK